VRTSSCGKPGKMIMKPKGFLVKGGGMDRAMYQGTAAINPTCLNACK